MHARPAPTRLFITALDWRESKPRRSRSSRLNVTCSPGRVSSCLRGGGGGGRRGAIVMSAAAAGASQRGSASAAAAAAAADRSGGRAAPLGHQRVDALHRGVDALQAQLAAHVAGQRRVLARRQLRRRARLRARHAVAHHVAQPLQLLAALQRAQRGRGPAGGRVGTVGAGLERRALTAPAAPAGSPSRQPQQQPQQQAAPAGRSALAPGLARRGDHLGDEARGGGREAGGAGGQRGGGRAGGRGQLVQRAAADVEAERSGVLGARLGRRAPADRLAARCGGAAAATPAARSRSRRAGEQVRPRPGDPRGSRAAAAAARTWRAPAGRVLDRVPRGLQVVERQQRLAVPGGRGQVLALAHAGRGAAPPPRGRRLNVGLRAQLQRLERRRRTVGGAAALVRRPRRAGARARRVAGPAARRCLGALAGGAARRAARRRRRGGGALARRRGAPWQLLAGAQRIARRGRRRRRRRAGVLAAQLDDIEA
jgi:hypothetical protein